ncbi:MAG: valine--tRNA ligase [Bacteriovoracaceae bacterium]|nr:valine--tRNA ligase [Bacteriovoracaceae bacterium]
MKIKKLPKKYNAGQMEPFWTEAWNSKQIYKYDPSVSRENTFVVDTPPPTVSGSLHIGHVFSYTQTDILVRFQRMMGKNIFYPMGWDNNGLPTERRVQNSFGVLCDPTLAPQKDWSPTPTKNKKMNQFQKVSRPDFLKACAIQTKADEVKYEALWKNLGLSIDWNEQYATVAQHPRKISQASFLDLVDKGYVYSHKSPTMWDTTFQTAVAQAEVEDKERDSAYYDIRFKVEAGGEFIISTTRPELLAACVAVVAHPDDERFKHLFGKYAITPLFEAKVPIMAAEHADPQKGTGILMVCTFGDIHDVEFWKQQKLPLKEIIGKSGRLLDIKFGEGVYGSENPVSANKYYSTIQGLYAKQARAKVVELLGSEHTCLLGMGSALVGDARPTKHSVKFYEKGDLPLEYVTTRQWFIRVLEHKNSLLAQGKKVKWHPPHMLERLDSWIEGLNQDWCISRQRYFGVPFPVWYPLDEGGQPDYDNPIFADFKSLPVDPQVDLPKGYKKEQRGMPGGFIGDPDVMDTWATSSLTPQISSHWSQDQARHGQLFPADVRPQAHEIIRTWAFYTIAKAWMHESAIPWKNIVISGWVVNPDKKKMSKSKGKVVTPEGLIEKYSADSLRYWAGRAKLGQDTMFDESVFKIGQRLITKLFNVSKFVMLQLKEEGGGDTTIDWGIGDIKEPLDRAWINKLNDLINFSQERFANYEYSAVLSKTESTFWDFCDNYVELVKNRTYKQKNTSQGQSGVATLAYSLKVFLRLFAPFVPYITEEVWSWYFSEQDDTAHIHQAKWPSSSEIQSVEMASNDLLVSATFVLNKIRSAKTNAQKSLKWEVEKLELKGAAPLINNFKQVMNDVVQAGNVSSSGVELIETDTPDELLLKVDITLSDNQ